jgi:hypothetical protein
MNIRLLPWILAVVGLGIPFVGSGFGLWRLMVVWAVVFVAVWLTLRVVVTTRGRRIAMALVLLPILFLLVFEGGWYLIPADLAWLAIEVFDRRTAAPRASRSG